MYLFQDVDLPPTLRRFLPELLPLIFSALTSAHAEEHLVDEPAGWRARNADLHAASLVSKEWHAEANRALYGDLRLEWAGRKARVIRPSSCGTSSTPSRLHEGAGKNG